MGPQTYGLKEDGEALKLTRPFPVGFIQLKTWRIPKKLEFRGIWKQREMCKY